MRGGRAMRRAPSSARVVTVPMIPRLLWVLLVLLVLLVLSGLTVLMTGCDRPVEISDTGYQGTWARGTDRAQSVISILPRGERYLFRWRVWSKDGRWQVRCGWDGRCEEMVDAKKSSEYTFRTWIDPETKLLMVECTGKVFEPKPLDIHYLDVLSLEPGGKVLWSHTIERGGQHYEGDARPMRSFNKVSNAVSDSPPG